MDSLDYNVCTLLKIYNNLHPMTSLYGKNAKEIVKIILLDSSADHLNLSLFHKEKKRSGIF